MTAVDERPITGMAKTFEDLEVPEGLKAELLRGEIVMMAGPDRVHNRIVQSVQDQIPHKRWDRLQTQDIAIPGESSEPQPDLVVLERGAEEGPGRLIPAPAVELVLEVVSKTSGDRDYGIKRSMYAAGRVPAYLIVDPTSARCVLLTEPTGSGEDADYRTVRTSKFGEPVPLPMLDVELDTSEFETLPGIRTHRRP
ncbi:MULTISPECIES: Uma2 family endonuclease [unclassified Streptomyces]|uniref:Uma2 family endonuclease n=1 Tax=unclassified Streptomyces TaxID=2593676 RepID=UPI003814151C